MISGLSGSLLSHDAVERLLRTQGEGGLALPAPGAADERLRAWHADVRARLGPTAGPRTVFDEVAEPLARSLGFAVIPLSGGAETVDALLLTGGVQVAVMIVTAWGQAQGAAWRHAVHRGLAHGARWCLCISGTAVRMVDADRAYSRRYAEFDLALALEDDRTFPVLWGLLHSNALAPKLDGPLLDRVVALCEQHRTEVRLSLREGVHDALLRLIAAFRAVSSKRHDSQLLDESLIVVYRILFLLFAEARSLVPSWHPVYHDGYT
ncbi:MAG: hypothetical protein ACRD15_18015, partial [Vicinamibacterales bacterium]